MRLLGTILLVALGLVFVENVIVIGVGLVPTVVAAVIDRRPERFATFSVAAMNLVGVVPFLLDLWEEGSTMENALEIISDPFYWLSGYAAASVGWLIFFSMPAVCGVIVKMRHDSKVESLRKYQEDLIEEWGREVAHIPGQEGVDLPDTKGDKSDGAKAAKDGKKQAEKPGKAVPGKAA